MAKWWYSGWIVYSGDKRVICVFLQHELFVSFTCKGRNATPNIVIQRFAGSIGSVWKLGGERYWFKCRIINFIKSFYNNWIIFKKNTTSFYPLLGFYDQLKQRLINNHSFVLSTDRISISRLMYEESIKSNRHKIIVIRKIFTVYSSCWWIKYNINDPLVYLFMIIKLQTRVVWRCSWRRWWPAGWKIQIWTSFFQFIGYRKTSFNISSVVNSLKFLSLSAWTNFRTSWAVNKLTKK